MDTELYINPESHAESELLKDLAAVREMALDEGIDREVVARVMMVYGEALLREEFGGSDLHASSERPHHCPNCGVEIEDVEILGLGHMPEIIPCGCEVEIDNIPGDLV
jgi:hypothetical protein